MKKIAITVFILGLFFAAAGGFAEAYGRTCNGGYCTNLYQNTFNRNYSYGYGASGFTYPVSNYSYSYPYYGSAYSIWNNNLNMLGNGSYSYNVPGYDNQYRTYVYNPGVTSYGYAPFNYGYGSYYGGVGYDTSFYSGLNYYNSYFGY